jgi:hypothetical protein
MDQLSERRLAENEVIFRQRNKKIQVHMDELKAVAKAEGQQNSVEEIDFELSFYCECSDPRCQKRIELLPSKYQELHQNRMQFVLIPGHDVEAIEHVVESWANYVVTEKYKEPPKSANTLNVVDLDKT